MQERKAIEINSAFAQREGAHKARNRYLDFGKSKQSLSQEFFPCKSNTSKNQDSYPLIFIRFRFSISITPLCKVLVKGRQPRLTR